MPKGMLPVRAGSHLSDLSISNTASLPGSNGNQITAPLPPCYGLNGPFFNRKPYRLIPEKSIAGEEWSGAPTDLEMETWKAAVIRSRIMSFAGSRGVRNLPSAWPRMAHT